MMGRYWIVSMLASFAAVISNSSAFVIGKYLLTIKTSYCSIVLNYLFEI